MSTTANCFLILTTLLAACGCSTRASQTFRLVPQQNDMIVVPPGVARADAAQGALSTKTPKGRPCASTGDALTLKRRGGTLRISVARDALIKEPAGWLRQWSAEMEAQGCVPAGAGLELAARILDSVPLDPWAAFRLMHGDSVQKGYVELGTENRLQTQAPILKSGKPPETNQIDIDNVTGHGYSLNVDIRESDEAIGVETAWYALRPKTDGPGSTIVVLSVERTVEGNSLPATSPQTDYFHFAPDIGFYRLIYKADLEERGATKAIVVGAPDRIELERRTRLVLDDLNACKVSDPEMCMVIPRHVGLNPALAVTVNGQEVRVEGIRSTVRTAIWQAHGPQRMEDVLPSLEVKRPYGGKLVEVEFDRSGSAILNMTLLGGEAIAWK